MSREDLTVTGGGFFQHGDEVKRQSFEDRHVAPTKTSHEPAKRPRACVDEVSSFHAACLRASDEWLAVVNNISKRPASGASEIPVQCRVTLCTNPPVLLYRYRTFIRDESVEALSSDERFPSN